jgi:hypothetical protein
MPTPYQPSGSVSYLSRFPFASRPRQEDVPLFQGFEQEDDETQHERDMADYLALQKSRRNFIPSHLTESSEIEDHNLDSSIIASRASLSASRQKSAMVDVELGSTDNDDAYSDFDSIDRELDARPPAFQTFQPSVPPPQSAFLPQETDPESAYAHPRPPSPDADSVPPTVILPAPEPPRHDMFWS